ncbi:hypothetical protein D3C87_1931760 [compost metagenome]
MSSPSPAGSTSVHMRPLKRLQKLLASRAEEARVAPVRVLTIAKVLMGAYLPPPAQLVSSSSATGPKITMKMTGKMKKTSGKVILTGAW